MQDGPAHTGKEFDLDTWREQLLALNPWARGLTIDEENAEFAAARQMATLARYADGKEAWNAWANGMLSLKVKLEAAGKWAAKRKYAWEPLAGENEVTRAWIALACAVFSTKATRHTFESDVAFAECIFCGIADFEGATFLGAAKFESVTFCGDAKFRSTIFVAVTNSFERATFSGDADFQSAEFSAAGTNFMNATFSGEANFQNATFSGIAAFVEATFSGEANFQSATFSDTAGFGNATFSRNASFRLATFSGLANFGNSTFEAGADLNKAQFNASANFAQAKFKAAATFDRSRFAQDARFEAIDSSGIFSLTDTAFDRVPSLFGATFKGALRLDNVRTPPYRWTFGYTPDENATARFRELKRRANEAQDHERELEFFSQEVRTGRFHAKGLPVWVPKVWSWRFWFGLAFEVFSDFGRSLWRPLLWWLILTAVFSAFYLGEHEDVRNARAALNPTGALSTIAAYAVTTRGAWTNPPPCRAQGFPATDVLTEARVLSVRNAMVYDFGRMDTARRTYSCLFGGESNAGESDYLRTIPPRIWVAASIQGFLSAILIFLFLLAVRNLLRLK
jgi:hypothetical protein